MQEYIDFFTNNPMLSVAWIVIAGMLVNMTIKSKFSKIKNIDAQEAVILMNKQDALVVDIRTAEDFKKGHIIDAKNIPVSQIYKGSFSAIENSKNKPIIVVCDTGTRSSGAANKLFKAGFEDVYNLASGMGGWLSANLPTTKK
ncbi:MAG TPA: rhodanese-like domain-containing protein [Psychromonas hadalis]|nr:rhodanese-like domain-containing protein [Psychromonas hadalis]